MHIGPVVSRALLFVLANDSIAAAARKMTDRKVGSAVVMTDQGPGIITERDILRAVASGADLETAPVEDYMTHNAITAFEDCLSRTSTVPSGSSGELAMPSEPSTQDATTG